MLTQDQITQSKIAFQEINRLLNTEELQNRGLHANSVLNQILINMKDLLMKSKIFLNKRVDFTDDILIDDNVKDITDLISHFRDGANHLESDKRKAAGGYNFAQTFYNMPKGFTIVLGETEHVLNYPDDIVYTMGNQIMYLKRHLLRAYYELQLNFKPYI